MGDDGDKKGKIIVCSRRAVFEKQGLTKDSLRF